MNNAYVLLSLFGPLVSLVKFISAVDKETLAWIVILQAIFLMFVLGYEIQKYFRGKRPTFFFRFFRKVRLDVTLEKDREFRPQVLTMIIRNVGKHEADIDAPVLEYRKIWSTRRFKLNGYNGKQIYPMYIGPQKSHQLSIETSTFHMYDKEVKTYYWARILVTDVEGRKWKSNSVKLRKSLVT